MSKAREKRYRRLISALRAAEKAASDVLWLDLPRDESERQDHSLKRLRDGMGEYAGYLDSATWWRA